MLDPHWPPAPHRRPLIEMWLEGRSPQTLKAYRDDVRDFGRFLALTGVVVAEETIAFLIARTHAEGNELVLSYRNAMLDGTWPGQGTAKLAPATINRRIGALRSLIKLANTLGHVTWLLGVQNVKHEKYRDTSGPGVVKINQMLEALGETSKQHRNRAMIEMLFRMGLRRGEVVELQLEHVVLDGVDDRVSILGKGRKERTVLSMPPAVTEALKVWLAERGSEPGPLFGLGGNGLWRAVRALAKKAGVGAARPHGLRHSGITRALDVTDGNMREVQKFSRHKNVNTLLIYDDNRKNVFKEIAEKI